MMLFNLRIKVNTGDIQLNQQCVDSIDTVTMRGLETIASVLGAPYSCTDSWMPYIAFGDGEESPSTEDKTLEHEIWRKKGVVTRSGSDYVIEATFSTSEPITACVVREVGLLNDLVGGILGARWLLSEDYAKPAGESLYVKCIITIQ